MPTRYNILYVFNLKPYLKYYNSKYTLYLIFYLTYSIALLRFNYIKYYTSI